MKRGSKVSFSWESSPGALTSGTGEIISEVDDDDGKPIGRVQVAVDPVPPEARHFVIFCTVTWLTELTP